MAKRGRTAEEFGSEPKFALRDLVTGLLSETTEPMTIKAIVAKLGTGSIDALEDLVADQVVARRKTYTKGRPYEHLLAGTEWPPHRVTPLEAAEQKYARDRVRKLAKRGCVITAGEVIAARREAKLAKAAVPEAAPQPQSAEPLDVSAGGEPWPFYNEKFLPYTHFMDAKMRRRYERTAAVYGHKYQSVAKGSI